MQQAKQKQPSIKKVKKARFRLLPAVIFVCVLMLSVRVGVVWRSLFTWEAQKELVVSGLSVAAAQAEKKETETPKKESEKTTGGGVTQDFNPKVTFPTPAPRPTDSAFSQSELEVLKKLAGRREELDLRERELSQKSAVLQAAEAQIDSKIAKLKELEKAIKDVVGVYDEKEKERLNNLVKIYSSMKPKEAARLFDQMEMDLLTRLFERMKEAKSAPILAMMTTAKANALTSELANRKKLPGFDSLGATP